MVKKIGQGKVRDIYDVDDDRLVIVSSDRVSAFDSVLPNEIPNKGRVLNRMSAYWFDFTKEVLPNHMISISRSDLPIEFRDREFEGRTMLVKKLTMLPIECIVRGYITGSGWESYKKSGKVCGIELPEGLKESQKLKRPIYTPTTKETEGHDEHISFEQTVELLGEILACKVRKKSIELYEICAAMAAHRGIIIADTKLEFGLDEKGKLYVADEMFTPDSSRFWSKKQYKVGCSQESFDKQYLRDYLTQSGWNKEPPAPEIPADVIEKTSAKYVQAFEMVTGQNF